MNRYDIARHRRSRGLLAARLSAYALIPLLTGAIIPPAAVPAPLALAARMAVRATVAVAAPAAPLHAAAQPNGDFRWPLDDPPRLVRRFDPPPQPWLAGHRGVDLAAGPATSVRAAGAGTVLFAGRIAGRGVVSVLHRHGLRTTYEPVEPAVRTGDAVGRGELLGVLAPGHPGCPAEACLHWGLRHGEEYLDPLTLLGLGRVRLLPLDGRRGQRRAVSRAGRRSASRSYSSARL